MPILRLRLSAKGELGGVLVWAAAGEDIKGGKAWRGAAGAPRISHLYPCPAYIARGDNSTGAPERFHYTASRGIISSDISLAVPAGFKFRTSDPSPSARHHR